jgi:AbrB family looped-hinge helix DNA binding protein
MDSVVMVDRQGRVTIPAGARRELGVGAPSVLVARVSRGRIVLVPAEVCPSGAPLTPEEA